MTIAVSGDRKLYSALEITESQPDTLPLVVSHSAKLPRKIHRKSFRKNAAKQCGRCGEGKNLLEADNPTKLISISTRKTFQFKFIQ
jgi:hypothetical protein